MQILFKRAKLALLPLLSMAIWAVASQLSSIPQIVQLPGDLTWAANPNFHGLQTVVLFGNPKAEGQYVERIRLPAHFRLKPHSHPNKYRMVTVISGTFYYAYGDSFDEGKLQTMPAGSFFTEPENVPHYSLTKDEEVILQLNATGPAGVKYLEEDPN